MKEQEEELVGHIISEVEQKEKEEREGEKKRKGRVEKKEVWEGYVFYY